MSFLPGFHPQRTFDWSDPVDLAGEGFRLPEAAHPSAAVKAVRKAGFKGAAGERLVAGRPPDEAEFTGGVVKTASAAKARGLRDWMHAEDLQQPCFSQCIYSPKALTIPGVPSGVAVSQLPDPSIKGPPTHYFVEFTVGPYLYFGHVDARPRDQAHFLVVARRYYQRVRSL